MSTRPYSSGQHPPDPGLVHPAGPAGAGSGPPAAAVPDVRAGPENLPRGGGARAHPAGTARVREPAQTGFPGRAAGAV